MPPDGFASRMVEEARRSVVQVGQDGRGAGSGAGVIWPQDGLVLTNHHVVAGGRQGGRRVGRRGGKPLVTLGDGQAFEAEVIRRSRSLDLALLKANAGDLPAAVVGDSDALRVGEMVFAIGHPWGLLGTVTAGVVSGIGEARGRGFAGEARYVQSDVALAPGNSGGPLLNARGEVVGINAMIFGGLSLAIPANAASAWAAGDVEPRPRLGVGLVPVALREGRRARTGLAVAAVERDTPAQRAGLLVGDVLLGVGDEPADGVGALADALARAGGVARLRVMRGGKILSVDVDLGVSGPGRAA